VAHQGLEQERKLGLPLHPMSKRRYATAAACIGTAAAVHYFSKNNRPHERVRFIDEHAR